MTENLKISKKIPCARDFDTKNNQFPLAFCCSKLLQRLESTPRQQQQPASYFGASLWTVWYSTGDQRQNAEEAQKIKSLSCSRAAYSSRERVIIAANLNYVISCAPGIREMKKKIELDCYKKKSSGKNGSAQGGIKTGVFKGRACNLMVLRGDARALLMCERTHISFL